MAGEAWNCPHCGERILRSAVACPACRRHLRLDAVTTGRPVRPMLCPLGVKAARGDDGREFPWGAQWTEQRANLAGSVGRTTAVGQFPRGASPYGVHDMTGNVWEWVADWYDGDYYKSGVTMNPAGPATGVMRGSRGGGFVTHPLMARVAARWKGNPALANNHLGFRCVRGGP